MCIHSIVSQCGHLLQLGSVDSFCWSMRISSLLGRARQKNGKIEFQGRDQVSCLRSLPGEAELAADLIRTSRIYIISGGSTNSQMPAFFRKGAMETFFYQRFCPQVLWLSRHKLKQKACVTWLMHEREKRREKTRERERRGSWTVKE